MRKLGFVLAVAGFVIAALATAQFELVLMLTSDPNPNPVINGVLMWFGWAFGALLVIVGGLLTLAAGASRQSH